jgi:hypothetical protein
MNGHDTEPLIEASRCGSCGRSIIPPRERCPYCRGTMERAAVEGEGKVLSWTTVHITPEGVPSPRTVALVRLDRGACVLCLVPDERKLEMGMAVEVESINGLFQLK